MLSATQPLYEDDVTYDEPSLWSATPFSHLITGADILIDALRSYRRPEG